MSLIGGTAGMVAAEPLTAIFYFSDDLVVFTRFGSQFLDGAGFVHLLGCPA